MFWKICFVIYSLLFILMVTMGYNTTELDIMSNWASLRGSLEVISIALFLSLFYALGWKKKLFSLKAVNYVLAYFIFGIFLFLTDVGIGAYDAFIEMQSQQSLPLAAGIFIIIFVLAITFIIFNILVLPFYIGIYKYKKNFETLEDTDKPYWKILTGFALLAYVPFIVQVGLHYKNILLYNSVDYFAILSCIYEIFFLIGFSWNRKPKSAMFWQATCIPYLIGSALTYFYLSPQFKADFPLMNSPDNFVDITTEVVLFALYAYMLYKYSFRKNNIENL